MSDTSTSNVVTVTSFTDMELVVECSIPGRFVATFPDGTQVSVRVTRTDAPPTQHGQVVAGSHPLANPRPTARWGPGHPEYERRKAALDAELDEYMSHRT